MDYNIITAREKIFDPLWRRMDYDMNLIEDYKYVLRDYKSKGYKPIPKAYSVTRPLPQNDYNKYTNKLIALKRKIKVLTDDGEFDEGKIIQFCEDSDFAVDSRLSQRPVHTSRALHYAHICSRGWVAEQELWRYDGKLIADSRPIDPRWLVWDTDGEDLAWACAIFYRYPREINDEYGTEYGGEELLKVRVCWSKEVNVVYVDGNEVFYQDNWYKNIDGEPYVPFVIRPAPFGPINGDEDNMENIGESIFYPLRNTYDEANYSASIIKTQTKEDLFPALQTPGKAPKKYPGSNDIVEEQTEALALVPRRDMSNSMRNYQGTTDRDLQTGGFSRVDFGSISSPMSGDAIDALNRGGSEVLNSRIIGLKSFDAAVYRMRLDQFIQIGKKLNVGRSRKHSPSELNGEYDLSVHYVDTSLERYARAGATAASFIGVMPPKWIRDEIIMADDPDKADDLVDIEDTERQVPVVYMIDRTLDYIRQNTDEANEKAWVLAIQCLAMIKQMAQGQPAQPQEQTQPKPTVNLSTKEVANAQN